MLPQLWDYAAHPFLTTGAIYVMLCFTAIAAILKMMTEEDI